MVKCRNVLLTIGLLINSVTLYSDGNNDSLVAEMSKTAMAADVKPNGTSGPSLASAYPVVEEDLLHIAVGALVQQVRVSNTDVCYKKTLNPSTAATPLNTTYDSPYELDSMKRMKFDVNAGLRAELGFDSRFDDWRFNSVFEWFSSTGNVNGPLLAGGDAGIYIPTGTVSIYYPGNTAGGIDFARMNASLQVSYYMLDVMLSRGSYLSNTYSFLPYMGIHAAWMYFDGSQRYRNGVNNVVILPSDYSWIWKSFASFWGVGPSFGFDGVYYLTDGFSLFGMSTLAVLFGQANVTTYTGFMLVPAIPGQNRVRDTQNLLTTYVRGIFGIQYEKSIPSYGKFFQVRAGFDSRLYLDPYPIVRMEADEAAALKTSGNAQLLPGPRIEESGDFGMVGFIITVGIDF